MKWTPVTKTKPIIFIRLLGVDADNMIDVYSYEPDHCVNREEPCFVAELCHDICRDDIVYWIYFDDIDKPINLLPEITDVNYQTDFAIEEPWK